MMPAPVDRTDGELDRAIIAYREDPSAANRARVMAAQRAHIQDFYAEQARDYMTRTGVR